MQLYLNAMQLSWNAMQHFLKAQVGWIGRGNEVRPHGLATHLLYHRLQGSLHLVVVISILNIELLPSYIIKSAYRIILLLQAGRIALFENGKKYFDKSDLKVEN